MTNPPFSLFREYIAILQEHRKSFIVIGNQNAITYKEIFPLLRDNKIWIGVKSGDMAFMVPEYYEARETRYWEDENGQKWRSLGNICWFTNLDIKKRHEELILVKRYNSNAYLHYVNYDAINVDKVADIPCDYAGVMGIPITFMEKYNPDQFEILGTSDNGIVPDEYKTTPGLSKNLLTTIIKLEEKVLIKKEILPLVFIKTELHQWFIKESLFATNTLNRQKERIRNAY